MGALRHSTEGNYLLTTLPSGYHLQLGGGGIFCVFSLMGFFFLVGSLSEGKSEPHAVGWLL